MEKNSEIFYPPPSTFCQDMSNLLLSTKSFQNLGFSSIIQISLFKTRITYELFSRYKTKNHH